LKQNHSNGTTAPTRKILPSNQGIIPWKGVHALGHQQPKVSKVQGHGHLRHGQAMSKVARALPPWKVPCIGDAKGYTTIHKPTSMHEDADVGEQFSRPLRTHHSRSVRVLEHAPVHSPFPQNSSKT
jgi:hypothetical protein